MRRKAVETAKFHFFDTGVVRALRRLPRIRETSADFSEFFEHSPTIISSRPAGGSRPTPSSGRDCAW